MKLSPFKKITIIAERVLRDSLLELLHKSGATGHTLTAVEGAGSRGLNAIDFEGRHIQIETIVPESVVEPILGGIEEGFLEDFAIIAYVSDVGVLRRGKFLTKNVSDSEEVSPGNKDADPGQGPSESN